MRGGKGGLLLSLPARPLWKSRRLDPFSCGIFSAPVEPNNTALPATPPVQHCTALQSTAQRSADYGPTLHWAAFQLNPRSTCAYQRAPRRILSRQKVPERRGATASAEQTRSRRHGDRRETA